MIVAGIVLYNPELTRLKENINSIIKQVNKLIIVDNNSDNKIEVKKLIDEYPNIILIENKINVGIAKALNLMCKRAYGDNYEWILTLDQDSVCPPNIIREYEKKINIPNLGILCPLINDLNNPLKEINNQDNTVEKCITSGSLVRLEAWSKVGGFDEWMFIDLVDFDFSKKIISKSYIIKQINSVILIHEIGSIKKFNILFKEINVMNHSAFRKYYMARNNLYFAKKYRLDESYVRAIIKNMKLFTLTLIFENQKHSKIKAIIKGTIDGFRADSTQDR